VIALPLESRGGRELDPALEIARQDGVERFAQQAGERRRGTTGRDRDLDLAALHDAAEVRGRRCRIVDGVTEQSARGRRGRNGAIDLWRRSGDDPACADQMRRRERRFDHGRAIADLIDAGSREAARAAMRSLQGEFSTMIQVLTGAVIELRTYVEAAIDFPEEEVDFLADQALTERLSNVRQHFDAVTRSAGQGRLLRDGMTVVLAGAPNAGKSSLLNRLAGYDAAIVTAVPGTTRDVLRERIHLDGMPLHILDTAGLRVALDAVEEEGIRRAQLEMARADRVLFVIDGAQDPTARAYRDLAGTLPAQVPVTLVYNKSDVTDAGAVSAPPGVPRIEVSALTGQGLEALRGHLKSSMGYFTLESGSVSARQRHIEALERARASVEEAARVLKETRAGELVAQELRAAQRALDEIGGEFTNEDLLGRIFSSFCIGK